MHDGPRGARTVRLAPGSAPAGGASAAVERGRCSAEGGGGGCSQGGGGSGTGSFIRGIWHRSTMCTWSGWKSGRRWLPRRLSHFSPPPPPPSPLIGGVRPAGTLWRSGLATGGGCRPVGPYPHATDGHTLPRLQVRGGAGGKGKRDGRGTNDSHVAAHCLLHICIHT